MDKKIWYFEDVDLYNILCPSKIDKHINQNPYTQFNKGDFLFLPNEMAKDIYLIAEGKVKVGYYDEEGNEHVKAFLGRGELLGEIAYLGQQKHKNFAECVKNGTKICQMCAEKARELSRDYVPFALEIHKKIASNIQRLERKLEILFCKDVRIRLEELLLDLHRMHHSGTGNKTTNWVEHGLTQQELASLIGASRKSVSLLLNVFEREGMIQIKSGKFRFIESPPKIGLPN